MKSIGYVAVLVIACLPSQAFADILQEKGKIHISVPGATWAMEFPISDFKLNIEKHRPDGKSDYYMLSSKTKKLNVSFYVEPINRCRTSTECRDMYWSNPGPWVVNPQRVEKYELNGFSIVRFYLPEIKIKEFTLDQMNISGHIVRNDYWIDMHISKVLFQEGDMNMFHEFINSISFKNQ